MDNWAVLNHKSQLTPASPFTENVKMKSYSPYLVATLNTSAYLGFVPFHVRYNEETELYHIAPVGLVRKLMCALVNILSLEHSIIYCILLLPSFLSHITQPGSDLTLSSGFSLLFLLASSFFSFILNGLFMGLYWKGQSQSQLLHLIQSTRVPYRERFARMHRLIVLNFFTLSTGESVTFCVPLLAICNFVYRYYDPGEVEPEDLQVNLNWQGVWKILSYHAAGYGYCCTSYVLVLVILSVSQVCNKFCRDLRELRIAEGMERYRELKKISEHVDAVFGNIIMIYYIMSVVYYAKIADISVWAVPARWVALVVYLATGFVFWLASAELHSKTRNAMQKWLTSVHERKDLTLEMRMKLMVVYNENLMDPVGISCRFFTITYGFLGTMMGLIVTYAIILLQFQMVINQGGTNRRK